MSRPSRKGRDGCPVRPLSLSFEKFEKKTADRSRKTVQDSETQHGSRQKRFCIPMNYFTELG